MNDFFSFILLIVATLVYNDKKEEDINKPILNLDIEHPDLEESSTELLLDDIEN